MTLLACRAPRSRTARLDEGGRALAGLDEVRVDRVAQNHLHGADGQNVARVNRIAPVGKRDHHGAEPFAEVEEVARQAEDGHDLARGRYGKAVFAGDTVLDAPEPHDDFTERPVV